MPERKVGKVEHYYPKVKAAAVGLSGPLKVGDKVHIVGHGDDFQEKVESLQLDHKPIREGKPGQSVGLWVKERVHEGDDVYLVEPGAKAAAAKAAPKRAAQPASRARKAPARKAAKRTKRKAPARKPKRKASSRRKPARKAPKRKAAKRKTPARKAKRVARKGRGR